MPQGLRAASNEPAMEGGSKEELTCDSQQASNSWAGIFISVGRLPSGERMATSLAMAAAVLG